MKIKRRALSLLLSLVMVLTFMPAMSFADSKESKDSDIPIGIELMYESGTYRIARDGYYRTDGYNNDDDEWVATSEEYYYYYPPRFFEGDIIVVNYSDRNVRFINKEVSDGEDSWLAFVDEQDPNNVIYPEMEWVETQSYENRFEPGSRASFRVFIEDGEGNRIYSESYEAALDEEGDDEEDFFTGEVVVSEDIAVGDTKTVTIENAYDYASYKFVPEVSGTYCFKSTGSSDAYGRILDKNQEELYSNDDGAEGSNFYINFEAEAEETYYLQACLYGSNIGSFTVELSDEEYVPLESFGGEIVASGSIIVGQIKDVTVENAFDYASFEFVPALSGTYCFKGLGSKDTIGRVLDDSMNVIYKADDGDIGSQNFFINFDAEAGRTYYLQGGLYDINTGSFSVSLVDKVYDPEEAYAVTDIDGIRYRLIEPNSSEAMIEYSLGSLGASATIPSEVTLSNGKTCKVTEISSMAFANEHSLKSIFIPASVEFVGDHAAGYIRTGDEEWVFVPVEGFVIDAPAGSAGAKYAEDNNIAHVDTEAERAAAEKAAAEKAAAEKAAAEKAAAEKAAAEKAAAEKAAAEKAAAEKAAAEKAAAEKAAAEKAAAEKAAAEKAAAEKAAAEKADLAKTAAGTTHKVSGSKYKVLTNVSGTKVGTVALTTAKNAKSVTVPAAIKLNGKTFKVTQINAKAFKGKKIHTVTIGKNVKMIKKNAFKGSKATKLVLKTKLLKKAKVKGCLKSSKIKTVQVKVGSKTNNKKYVKSYKKIFTKANAGKKVTVK